MSEKRESVSVLEQAIQVQLKKSADYQNPNSTVVQADYYPNGVSTIHDVIWAKCLRAKSLLESEAEVKNEALEDTYLDMINYASFAVAWLRGKIPGQRADRDFKNRPIAPPVGLSPDGTWSTGEMPYPELWKVGRNGGSE